MTPTHYSRYNKRLTAYGYTHEQAYAVPIRQPLWQWLIEQEEGLPIIEVIQRELDHGISVSEIARGFDVKICTLYHWVRKWKKQGLLQ